MENTQLIFDKIDTLKEANPSFNEIFSDFDENFTLFMDNMSGIDDEDEMLIFGTNSSY